MSFRILIDGAVQVATGIVQGIGFLPGGGEEKPRHHDTRETLDVIAGIGVADLGGEEVNSAPVDILYVPLRTRPCVDHIRGTAELPTLFPRGPLCRRGLSLCECR